MATKRVRRPTGATTKGATLAELQTLLRTAGLRSTGPRIAVLGDLLGRRRPASHADLCDALTKDGFDRATLYRNLIDLADAGLVSRVDLGDHVWRFEVKGRGGDHAANHPHFVCSACGDVRCLPDVSVQITRGRSAPRSLATGEVAVQLTALCDACS